MFGLTIISDINQNAKINLDATGSTPRWLTVNGEEFKAWNKEASGEASNFYSQDFPLKEGANTIFYATFGQKSRSTLGLGIVGANNQALSGLKQVVGEAEQRIVAGYKILSPQGGEKFKIGDEIEFIWLAGEDVVQTYLEVSLDGRVWVDIIGDGIMKESHPNYGAYKWRIPETIDIKKDGQSNITSLERVTFYLE